MKGRNTRTEGLLPSDSQDSGSGSMAALTDWVLSHKRLVLGLWLVIWVAAVAAVGPAGSSLSQQFNVPGREGFETNKELAEIYGAGGDVAPIVPVVTLPEGTDGRFARRPRGARCGAGEGGGGAAGVDQRLLCLDRRPGVRLRRRPHHLRARLHPGQGRRRPRAGGGPCGAGRARRRHRRRIPGRGDRARRAPRPPSGISRGLAPASCWGRCWLRWARCSSSPSSSARSWPLCRS